jgi:acyl-CoA thioesterase-1
MIMVRKIYRLTLLLVPLACTNDAPPPSDGALSERASTAIEASSDPVVLFLGTSLTAGLGVDPDAAFPALVQAKIDSLGWAFAVANMGVSGETSAGGLRLLPWLLRRPIAVLVLELGANDGLRGLDVEQLESNLDSIVVSTRRAYPDVRVVIAGMQAPPDLGRRYSTEFRLVYERLAARHDAALIPFLLEDVGGVPALNQEDGIHPTVEGHAIIAETVWRTVEPVLRSLVAEAVPN